LILQTDSYGNTQKEVEVIIDVEKSSENLYFSDLAGRNSHYYAVYVCNQKWMNYQTDENSQPVFCPNEEIRYSQLVEILQRAIPNSEKMLHSSKTENNSVSVDDQKITVEEAKEWICELSQGKNLPAIEVGNTNGESRPLTREDLAVLLTECLF